MNDEIHGERTLTRRIEAYRWNWAGHEVRPAEWDCIQMPGHCNLGLHSGTRFAVPTNYWKLKSLLAGNLECCGEQLGLLVSTEAWNQHDATKALGI
jgi:hypothetical protein